MTTITPHHKTLTVLHDTQEYKAVLSGEIGEICIDGKKLNDIHDLTRQVSKQATLIKVLAIAAITIAVIATLALFYLTVWLGSNEEKIARLLATTDIAQHELIKAHYQWNSAKRHSAYVLLQKRLGWTFDENNKIWQQDVNTKLGITD